MSSGQIDQLVHQYGLVIVFAAAAAQAVGAPVPGTTVLVAAALYAAANHGLPIAGVIAAGAGGALVGMTAGFWLGRRATEERLVEVAARLRLGPQRVVWLRDEFAARGGAWVFCGRFVTGLRNVTGLLAGASGMAFPRFLRFAAAAAFVWATSAGLEYYLFGHALVSAPTWLQIALICLGLAVTLLSLRLAHRRAARRLGIGAAAAPER